MKKVKEEQVKIFSRFKDMTFKSYIKETLEFFNNNLKKIFIILSIISLLIILLGITSAISLIRNEAIDVTTITDFTFGQQYFNNIKTIAIIVFSGIVPYMYVPIVGTIAGTSTELITLAYLIVKKGYILACIMYILPMLITVCIINMATALGIYICKSITLGYKLDNMKHMNSINFKLELYKLTKKEDKKKQLEKKKNQKIKVLEDKHNKIDYFHVINITIILFLLQLIASILRVVII